MNEDLPFSEMPPEPGLWDTGGLLCPFQPSLPEKVGQAFSKINLNSSDTLIDLGSGDGTVLLKAIECGAQKAIGIELNSDLCSQAEQKAQHLGHQVDIRNQSFLDCSLEEATVIYAYLLPEAFTELRPKIEQALSSSARVLISFTFPVSFLQGSYDSSSDCYFYFNN